MNRWWFALAVLSTIIVGGPPAFSQQPTSNLQQEVVARVGDKVITLAQFNRLIERNPEAGSANLPPEKKKALLEQYVNRLLYLEGARRMQLADRPEVVTKIEEATTAVLVNEYLRLQVTEPSKVSEAEVNAYWKEHRDELLTPLQVRARHILVALTPGGENEADALKRAEEILARIRAGEDFATLASQLSEDLGTKPRGGDLGFITPGRMVPEFDKAVFALKPGEVGGPVKTSFGYHLIKVEGRLDPSPRPYEVAREPIYGKLARQRQRDRHESVMGDLKASIKVELNPRIFDVEN